MREGSLPFDGLMLVTPAKQDVERDAVAAAWETGGGRVLRLDRFWDPPPLDASRVRLYGNDSFCLVLEQKLGLKLVSPADDLLLRVDHRWLQRELVVRSLREAESAHYPHFVKPLMPKLFRAGVYASAEALREECRGLEVETQIYLSEIVHFTNEVRSFVLEGRVLAAAVYEGEGDCDEAKAFVQRFVDATSLPRTCVIDAGYVERRGWAVIEANATWGAGLNGCDPFTVARCIEAAAV